MLRIRMLGLVTFTGESKPSPRLDWTTFMNTKESNAGISIQILQETNTEEMNFLCRSKNDRYLWEPGSEEGHLESIGIGVKRVERVWTHSSHHHLHATRKMIANCKRKEKVHYWLSNTCAITDNACKHR